MKNTDTVSSDRATSEFLEWQQKVKTYFANAAQQDADAFFRYVDSYAVEADSTVESIFTHTKDANGMNVLHVAVSNGNISLSQKLLDLPYKHALVQADKRQQNLLHFAVQAKSNVNDIVSLVMSHLNEADSTYSLITEVNADKLSPLQLALRLEDPSVFRYLAQFAQWNDSLAQVSTQGSLLQWAVLYGDSTAFETVINLLPAEAIAKEHEKNGSNLLCPPPLVLISAMSEPYASEMAGLLLQKCEDYADVLLTAVDVHQNTALYNAAETGNTKLVGIYLEQPKSLVEEMVNFLSQGRTPYVVASDAVKALLEPLTKDGLKVAQPYEPVGPVRLEAEDVKAAKKFKQQANALSAEDFQGAYELYVKALEAMRYSQAKVRGGYEEVKVSHEAAILLSNASYMKFNQVCTHLYAYTLACAQLYAYFYAHTCMHTLDWHTGADRRMSSNGHASWVERLWRWIVTGTKGTTERPWLCGQWGTMRRPPKCSTRPGPETAQTLL